MAESAISAVLGNVSTLALQETTLLCGASSEVEFLKHELNRLQGFLRDADNKQRRGDEGAAILVSQIKDAAYEADNVMEAAEYMCKRNRLKKGFMGAIARYGCLPSDLSTLHKVGVEIKSIRRNISEIFEYATRLKIVDDLDVANHVPMPTNVHPLKKLDEEKSWELFSSKALPSYKRSAIRNVDEFEKLGKRLAKKCDGLPLALAVLGGYLSKNLNAQIWSDILSDWPSTKNGQMMRDILARSYKDLPNHYLRTCFLYLAAFPEDYEINVAYLIELWIAESFIPHTPNHTLEETAQRYVTELAQRSLVQVVDRSRAHGWIEGIRIQDILHDWCIEEARQDGFLDAMDKTAVSLPKLRFLRVLCVENSALKDFSSMNQLTTFSLSMHPNIPAEVLNIFANMPHLVDISLHQFDVLDKMPAEFPQSVRRLVLVAHVIKEDPMPVLEKLPRLVVLELSGYKGLTMCCSSQGFPRLQKLRLGSFSIQEWRMEEGTMPKLFHLTLWDCEKMGKLPVGLLHLPSLGRLELIYMPQISEDDITLKELQQKGCEVETRG
ncbi:putative disease resistance protein At1g58400 [Triticum dicoccoides]|uniref:putative disease resistance protein At1g58400 n=1 Tax=Triticum dicoccoides TaxID=85692 RepID=UPI0018912FF1|nr:putative disease resistance protein At1g58400 [Triticum dicoccoides]